jgi:hypothetical protein
MSRRRRGEEARGPAIPHVYEGPEVLSSLLARAGAPLPAKDVAERFRAAQARGDARGEAISALFTAEPRFGSPDDARRLYGNLFALWDRLAAGGAVEDDVPAAEPDEDAAAEPAPPLPPRGAAEGDELTADVVEAVWKHLAAVDDRERRRLRDRFENAQPDLVAWLDAAPLPESGALAAQDLAFETWAMFDVAFGDRVAAVPFAALRALEREPPPLEAWQPALAAYAAEALDLAQDDDPAFGAAERAQVERVVAAVAAALGRGLAGDAA